MPDTQPNTVLPSVLIYDDVYKKHLTGPSAPEYPERCTAIMERLSAAPFIDGFKQLPPRKAREQPSKKQTVDLCRRRGSNPHTLADGGF